MNMKLSDWNNALDYAASVIEQLKLEGYNVDLNVYTMYDNRKGINFNLRDNQGGLFSTNNTGIKDNFEQMKDAIDGISILIKES